MHLDLMQQATDSSDVFRGGGYLTIRKRHHNYAYVTESRHVDLMQQSTDSNNVFREEHKISKSPESYMYIKESRYVDLIQQD